MLENKADKNPSLHGGRASLVVQTVRNLPEMQVTWVQSLGREGPLEKGMATPSSILTWRIPWMEEPGGLQSVQSQRIGHNRVMNTLQGKKVKSFSRVRLSVTHGL